MGCKVEGLGFRVEGLRLRLWGSLIHRLFNYRRTTSAGFVLPFTMPAYRGRHGVHWNAFPRAQLAAG